MTDREKVIKGLECCLKSVVETPYCDPCKDCPYKDPNVDICCLCIDKVKGDALTLLKEQEPIPCGEKIKAGDVVLDFYKCGYCKNAIRTPWKYCPFCGKEVKWDGFD